MNFSGFQHKQHHGLETKLSNTPTKPNTLLSIYLQRNRSSPSDTMSSQQNHDHVNQSKRRADHSGEMKHPTKRPRLFGFSEPQRRLVSQSSTQKIKQEEDVDDCVVGTVRIKQEEDVELIDLCDTDDEEEVNGSEKSQPSTTHMIFTIDFSGSMRNSDVKTKNRGLISRWDAVFDCISSLLKEQIDDQSDAMALVTVVIFNEEAKTLLERMPLVRNGQKVLKALDTARKMHLPKGGTVFAAGLERAKEVATSAASNASKYDKIRVKKKESASKDNVMLVFLSDGRPGDLKTDPPSAHVAMQSTFRHHKTTFPAAGTHIEAMQREHGDRFSLQLVCLCEQGRRVSITCFVSYPPRICTIYMHSISQFL